MNIKFDGNTMTLDGKTINVGDKAPLFVATRNDLSEFRLEDELGKVLVLSVVPSIDTGVCSIQASTFNEEAAKLSDDIKIVTISLDLPFAQKRFCAAKGIDKAEIVADYKDREFGEKYGFLIDELKLLTRGIVIIDKEGVVSYVEYVPEVTDEVNFEKALEEAKKLV